MKNMLVPLILLWLTVPARISADPLADALITLEMRQMDGLAQQRKRPGVTIKPFASDGCSGGMSVAWTYLSDIVPEFGRLAGARPPWESCCIQHDRIYWQGETDNGYRKRQQADEALKTCVRQTGEQQSAVLSQKLGLSQTEIKWLFGIAGDMMYNSVRFGGGPCSGLPWRWGYGWPHCMGVARLDTE